MKGFVAPTDEQVSKALALLDSNSDESVFMHCRRGSDRTGTVIACYRIAHDHWKNDQALKEARSYGMYSFEVGMKRYIQNFKPAERVAAGSDLPSSAGQPTTN
jgi:tyrosine-protein phosphatase SIW14